MQYHASELMMV